MIIDAHAHLGHDYVFEDDTSEDELLKWYKEYKIDGAVVQPFINRPYIKDTIEIHNRISKFCQENEGYFYGMASINPHFRPEDYEKEAERCINELNFVGLKITPIAHAVHPASKDGRHVFEVAKKLNVPVMVHTGAGIPFSDPASLLDVVSDFKDVKIVIAHAGSDLFYQQALYLAKKFDNVFLEPTWINIMNLKEMIETVGVRKIMFSSDQILNIPVELVKYRTLIKNDNELERVLSGTIMEVFDLILK